MGGNKKGKRKADKGRPRDSTGVGRGAVSQTTLAARAGEREKVDAAKEAAAEKKRHQRRENDRAKRHKPEEEGVHLSPPAPAAAAAAAPGAVSSALTGVGSPMTYSPAPHDPSTGAGRQAISRGKRNIEEALEAQGHGKRQQVQHLQAAARVPGSAVAAFAASLAADSAAAHAGERIKQALAEPKLNGEAKATMLAALSVGKGKDKPVLKFALGIAEGKQLSGGRKAQLRHDRKKRATCAGASWARAVDERKPRSDGYWFGEKGRQIHQIIEDKWVELATASPLKRRANKSEPGSVACLLLRVLKRRSRAMGARVPENCPLFKRFGPHYSVACRPARPTSPRPRPPADRSRRASPSWIGSA